MTMMPRWLEYALVLLASWLIAGALIGSDTVSTTTVTSTLSEKPQQEASSLDESWKSVHLFGQVSRNEVQPVKQVPNAPAEVSKLSIKLIGTVVAGGKSAAMLMKNAGKEHEVFFLGETIQPNVKLIEVYATEIVIDNGGKRENISIEEGKQLVSEASQEVARQVSRPTRPRVAQIDRRINREHMKSQLRNFSTLLSQARVTPHFTDKKADGFTISEIVKGSLYEEIGLQNGDVIQKVNGESVTSAEQAMRMYRELQNSTFIDVEINRGGITQQVSYTIQ